MPLLFVVAAVVVRSFLRPSSLSNQKRRHEMTESKDRRKGADFARAMVETSVGITSKHEFYKTFLWFILSRRYYRSESFSHAHFSPGSLVLLK